MTTGVRLHRTPGGTLAVSGQQLRQATPLVADVHVVEASGAPVTSLKSLSAYMAVTTKPDVMSPETLAAPLGNVSCAFLIQLLKSSFAIWSGEHVSVVVVLLHPLLLGEAAAAVA